MNTTVSNRLYRILFLLLVAPWVALALYRLGLGVGQLLTPGPNTVGEAGKVYFAARFQEGLSVFSSGREPPYYPAFHGALLHALVGAIGRVGGLGHTGLYGVGRFITVICTLGTFVLSGRFLERQGVPAKGVLPLMVLFFAAVGLSQHTYSYRPDNWVLCLSAACLFLTTSDNRRGWHLPVLMLLTVSAFFIKATGLTLWPVVSVAFCIRSERREAAWFAAGTGLLLLIICTVLQMTSGGAFLEAFQNALGVGFSFRQLTRVLASPLIWLPILAPLALLPAWLSASEPVSRNRIVLAWFWFATLGAAAVSALRLGSGPYYFVEAFLFGGLLLTWWLWETLTSSAPREGDRHLLLPALMLGGVFLGTQGLFSGISLIHHYLDRGRHPMDIAQYETLKFREARTQLAAELRALSSSDPFPFDWVCVSDDPGLNILLEKPLLVHPLVPSMMIAKGSLPPDALVEAVREQRIARIVLTGHNWGHGGVRRFPQGMLEAMEGRYVEVESENPYRIYRPAAE